MSERAATSVTPAERIELVRQSIAPPEGRRSRLGYISKDDFAALIGCSRTRVIAWTNAENPDYPEERYRVRLAELSGGRFMPDDFRRPDQPGPLATRLEQLAKELSNLTKALHVAGLAHEELKGRVEAMERQVQKPRVRTAAVTSPRVRRGS